MLPRGSLRQLTNSQWLSLGCLEYLILMLWYFKSEEFDFLSHSFNGRCTISNISSLMIFSFHQSKPKSTWKKNILWSILIQIDTWDSWLIGTLAFGYQEGRKRWLSLVINPNRNVQFILNCQLGLLFWFVVTSNYDQFRWKMAAKRWNDNHELWITHKDKKSPLLEMSIFAGS